MNNEIKVLWCAALRSGDYPQASGYLRTPEGYCCLGVLCELAVLAGVIPPGEQRKAGILGEFTYGRHRDCFTLPEKVTEWAGLFNDNPRVRGTGLDWDYDSDPTLEGVNDMRVPFSKIADIIEEEL